MNHFRPCWQGVLIMTFPMSHIQRYRRFVRILYIYRYRDDHFLTCAGKSNQTCRYEKLAGVSSGRETGFNLFLPRAAVQHGEWVGDTENGWISRSSAGEYVICRYQSVSVG